MGKRNGANYTDGVFDIRKQAVISGNCAIDALMYVNVLDESYMDEASAIAAEIFLIYRTSSEFLAIADKADPESESNKIAQIIVGALIEKNMLRKEDGERGVEAAAAEIAVAWALENI